VAHDGILYEVRDRTDDSVFLAVIVAVRRPRQGEQSRSILFLDRQPYGDLYQIIVVVQFFSCTPHNSYSLSRPGKQMSNSSRAKPYQTRSQSSRRSYITSPSSM
jgi:hypothetical protein